MSWRAQKQNGGRGAQLYPIQLYSNAATATGPRLGCEIRVDAKP